MYDASCARCGFRRAARTVVLAAGARRKCFDVRDDLCLDCAVAREKSGEVVDGLPPPG